VHEHAGPRVSRCIDLEDDLRADTTGCVVEAASWRSEDDQVADDDVADRYDGPDAAAHEGDATEAVSAHDMPAVLAAEREEADLTIVLAELIGHDRTSRSNG
jgi:hypothetical protein